MTNRQQFLRVAGDAEAVDPTLIGADEPVHAIQRGEDQRIVNSAGVAVVDAQ